MLLFIFVFFMVLHHNVIMELQMLNHAVLMSPQNPNDYRGKKNQTSDLSMKKNAFDHIAYSYGEVFRFKYLGCCSKRDARREKYEGHVKIIQERMEIKNLLSREASASALSKVLM